MNFQKIMYAILYFITAGVPAFSSQIAIPSQILYLMDASRTRYEFIDAAIECKSYRLSDKEGQGPIMLATKRLVVKKTPTEKFVNVETTFLQDGSAEETFKEKYYFSSRYDKKIRGKRDGSDVTGVIASTGSLTGIHCTVEDAVWGLCGYDRKILTKRIGQSFLSYDSQKHLYLLELRIEDVEQSTWLRLYIDPQKDYIPVTKEVLYPDKSLFIREECLNWTKVHNLWVPLKYTYYIIPKNTNRECGEYTVQSIQVNQPIKENLEFTFPSGTEVRDELRGIHYVVEQDDVSAKSTAADSNAVNVSPSVAIALPPSATNTQLADTAMKVQELLAKEKQAAAGVPSVVPIEISPSYIWVLPGKNEYVLSISADGKKPSLVKHTFEPDGLVVQGLENKIASDGKIRVSLERPAEHKAFADGVLTLEFADQKKTVHFVAAPLE